MAKKKYHKIKISPDGRKLSIEAMNYQGKDCLEDTKKIEAVLGLTNVVRRKKPDYFQEPEEVKNVSRQ